MATRMTELVLGGDGLIGSTVARLLRARGHRVVSLDLKSGCDLREVDASSFRDCDRVWFLAWDTGGSRYLEDVDKQHQMYMHNCELSLRVFDALAKTGKPFLFTTTQLAGQANAYGLTKLMAQHWSAQLGGKVARLWNVYGWEAPDSKSHVIADMVISGLVDHRVRCRTSGAERRRFLYKDDCAAALIRLFDSSRQAADIGGDEWLTIGQVAEEVAAQLGVDTSFGPSPGNEVIMAPENPVPGWEPTVSLRAGIAAVIADARAFLVREAELVDQTLSVQRHS